MTFIIQYHRRMTFECLRKKYVLRKLLGTDLDDLVSKVIWNRNRTETELDEYFVLENENEQQKFSQGELNDLFRDLALLRDEAELLAFRLKEKHMLKKDVCITHFMLAIVARTKR